ncbi:hypothetical protein ACFVJK_49220, partial [Streptomyces sp. NPDC127172]|uniref:hypothetical protein n=1 Tax=Streptomyces sp. NPDC127172 TaxID=3345382 RepID=UPI00363AD781
PGHHLQARPQRNLIKPWLRTACPSAAAFSKRRVRGMGLAGEPPRGGDLPGRIILVFCAVYFTAVSAYYLINPEGRALRGMERRLARWPFGDPVIRASELLRIFGLVFAAIAAICVISVIVMLI